MIAVRASLLISGLLAMAFLDEPTTAPKPPSAGARDDRNAQAAPGKEDKPKEGAPKKHRGKFTISKETTYVTGPLDKDGYIDYAAALNERLSRGVTPENNANVLIWMAIGPRPEGKEVASEYFKLMGMEPPPEKGEYFIDQGDYIKHHLKVDLESKEANQFYKQVGQCTKKPWSPKEHPNVASWLAANDKIATLVVDATKRPQYYSPMVPPKTEEGPGGLINTLLPGVMKCRGLAYLLVVRAMFRANQGQHDEAWQDLLACHRLGRLIERGAAAIEALVGIAIEGAAIWGEKDFLGRIALKTTEIRGFLEDLQKLPPIPELADHVDLGERFIQLDLIIMADRHGIPKDHGLLEVLGAEFILNGIDWDPAFRNINRWYDRMVKITRTRDRASSQREWEKFNADLKALKKKMDSGEVAKKIAKNIVEGEDFAKEKGEGVGDILIVLTAPAIQKVHDAHDRAKQYNDNLHLAFALELYRHEHKGYPEKLEALAPKYLKEIPIDFFSGKPLIYHSSTGGYTLYSVGVNGMDDGGQGFDDDPQGDDIVIRMPMPELPGK